MFGQRRHNSSYASFAFRVRLFLTILVPIIHAMQYRVSFLFIFLLGLAAQTRAQQPDRHCGADEMQLQLLQQHPELLPNWVRNYHLLEEHIQQYVPDISRGGGPYIIPVVVHIIHFDGAENISDDQVHNGIQVLTRNFRKQNPDTADIIPTFKPIAADMNVEFRLATLDPDGNCTNGINRLRSPLTSVGDHRVKDLIHWPRDRYLNIYVVKDAAGLAGHALMPFQADTIPEWDGIVIGGDYFGNIGTSNDLRSVVLSHEVGHFFNLYHCWGGNNVPGFYYLPCADAGNCAYDDGVGDTPNTIGWNNCNLSGASCGNTVDNVQNFMEYAYCARMFTEGQRLRVDGALNSSIAQRNNLWQTSNLALTGAYPSNNLCHADFHVPRQVCCVDEYISLEDASYHSPVAWNWDFGNGDISTVQNPSAIYNTPGRYTISLNVIGSNSLSVVKKNVVYVLPDSSLLLPFQQGFEWVDSLPPTRLVEINDAPDGWEVYTGAGATGNRSLKVHNEDDTLMYRYSLISPPLDLSGTVQPYIAFKYAFARQDSTNNDQLSVKVSKTCGANWSQLNVQSANLPTVSGYVNGGYVPAAADWRQIIVSNIPGTFRTSNFVFRIDFYSGGGNDFYLDDIHIFDNASVGLNEVETDLFASVYPNPSHGQFTVNGDFNQADLYITAMDGKQVYRQTSVWPGTMISTENLAPGMYFMTLEAEGSMRTVKLVVQ